MAGAQPVHKRRLNKMARALRGLLSAIDPRAYFHAIKLINYYNYTHVQQRRLLTIGASPSISPNAGFSNAERIFIGDRVRIGARCQLWAGPGAGVIRIGDDVLFGPEVMITAATYRYDDGHPVTDQAMDEGDVVIGDDVWLGTRAIVLPGAKIGDGAIIGAAALVRGEVPPMSIAVGAPARVVGGRRIRE